ncbi:MAG: Lipopolysaccharide core heptosyltransferase RfaQ [Pedosphaera sp.]|nr:Lipopolysaccharide core heptosyltransferase RfaQ [Pedosphaera sp.]
MKILVISLAGIGDTLMATPLIHELRANFPNAIIDVLSMWPASSGLLAGNPYFNNVYQKNLIKSGKIESLKFLTQLGKQRYDVSINTHPQSRIHYRVVTRLINARIRISHEYDHASIFDRLLVNRTLKQDYNIHCIENNLALLPLCGAKSLLPRHEYELFLTDAEHQWAADFIAKNNLAGRKRIGIHVGSGGTKNLALRRWPLAHYLALIKRLNQNRPDISILLFGGPEEEKDHARILAETGRTHVFVPHTKDIRQAAALVKHCDAFLSVDTALMHVAAAMKVPNQIVIETPTINKTVEPYNNPFVLIKNTVVAGRNLDYYRYDGADIKGTDEELIRCMASISVDEVCETLTKALDK